MRFIPTSVGNTQYRAKVKEEFAVHPHIRGEYPMYKETSARAVGSSPHPWGILSQSISPKLLARFIPTSVGNTK